MLRIILICSWIILALPIGVLSQVNSTDQPYTDITVEEIDSLLSRHDAVLLDVRTPEEIGKGKIGDALEADVLSPDFKARLQQLDKDKHYIVYCRSGRRSVTASKAMAEEGFKHVYNLTGGYQEWVKHNH